MIKEICSQENAVYKRAVALQDKKWRDREQAYLIEGPNLLKEALLNQTSLLQVFISADFTGQTKEQEEIFFLLKEEGLAPYLLPHGLFSKLSGTVNPQGILGVAKKCQDSEDTFFQGERRPGSTNVLVLDRLQDPGNLGTILRTADGAGILGIMVLKGTGDLFAPKVVRAAAGAHFRIPLLFVDEPEEAIALLKRYGKRIFATALSDSRNYFDCDLREDVAILIGNEGNGLSETLLRLADEKIKIPMAGSVESLNAAVAAGILLYESVRQRMQR